MAVTIIARVEEFVGVEGSQIVEMLVQRIPQCSCSLRRIIVCSAGRFGDDFIDYAEFFKVVCVNFERFGGLGGGAESFQRIAAHPSGDMTE